MNEWQKSGSEKSRLNAQLWVLTVTKLSGGLRPTSRRSA